MKKTFSIFLIILPILFSCTTISLVEIKYKPYCRTSIEGFYHSKRIYTGQTPVLFKKKWDKRALPIFGQIINTNNDGVYFKPVGKTFSTSTDTIYYKFSELDALIDSQNKIIYGKVPEKYLNQCEITLSFFNLEDPEKQIFKIDLEPNTYFGFCLNPGKYQIESITFTNEHDVKDQAVNYGTLLFEAYEGYSNYIGDIYLDNPDIDGQNIILPFKNVHNPAAGHGGIFASSAGIPFAVAGVVLTSLSVDYQSLKNIHTFTITNNEKFKSSSLNKLKSSFIYKIND